MYEVKIKNGNEEYILNEVSTNISASRLLSGSIKQGINTIDSFSFSILPNNKGYNKLKALTTLIEVINTKTKTTEFKGRVLIPVESMNSEGKFSKSVTCESELGYLMDSTTTYGEYHNISVKGFLEVIIQNHNNQVEEDKRFEVGNVTVIDNNDSLYRFLGYTKTLDAIKDKLIDRLGGELQIRYENGIRYLDYLESIGEVKTTEIRLAKNLKTIEQEKDPTSIISRLIPLGYKLEDSDERLTVANANNGSIYVDDNNAISEYGIIVDTVVFDDVTLSNNLLTKANKYLTENNRIKKKHKISALDLSLIGLDIESFEVGNSYRVVNELMNINEDLRVIEKTIDIYSPQSSSLTIGDKFEDIKTSNLLVKKKALAANEKAIENESKINKVKIEVKETAKGLESKVSADDVSSIIQQEPESIRVGFNGINDNIVISEDGLDINHGHFQLKNGNNIVVIDGENNIHKIISEGTATLEYTGDGDVLITIPHNLGYKPSFSAYQLGANGLDEYTNLPALTWSSGQIKAIIRARANNNELIFEYKIAADYPLDPLTVYIKYFIYKEVAF